MKNIIARFLVLTTLAWSMPITVVPAAVAGEMPNPKSIVSIADLDLGWASFPALKNYWGRNNVSFHSFDDRPGTFMRVFVPAGAIDPGTMHRRRLPRGGAGFKSDAFPSGVDHAVLSYWVRFPLSFDFVRGGKLPGLYGGKGNSGGKIPNGKDGFSFRLMWNKGGRGSVYAYVPGGVRYGTVYLRHKLSFQPGRWHHIVQELKLNRPGYSDGIVRMWLDDALVGEAVGVRMRTINELKINGMFFDVFFGGNDDSWAPKWDTHIDFYGFSLRGY